jgi:hypothetical protein
MVLSLKNGAYFDNEIPRMKTKAILFSMALLLVMGCASQNKTQNAGTKSFSGHGPSAFGAEAEEIWRKQLGRRIGHQNKAVVRAVRDGVAQVSTDDGKSWNDAKVGLVMLEGTTIRTDGKATCDLFLGDNGPVVRVTPDTELRIVHLSVQSVGTEKVIDTMLELPRGRILGNVKKLAAASSYLVRTQGGVIQIRGTEFSVTADGTLSIEYGAGVVYARGRVFEVKPGEKFSPATFR